MRRRQGATPEEIAMERDNAKYALDHHLHQLEEVSKLNKVRVCMLSALHDSSLTHSSLRD